MSVKDKEICTNKIKTIILIKYTYYYWGIFSIFVKKKSFPVLYFAFFLWNDQKGLSVLFNSIHFKVIPVNLS
jgi:hypothetical protein